MIDPSTLIGGGAAGGGMVIATVVYLIKANVGLQKDFDDFKLRVAENYVTASVLREFKEDMDKRFDKVEDLIKEGR